MINKENIYNTALSEDEINILNNNLLLAEFMGDEYSFYPIRLTCKKNKQGWKYSYRCKGENKKYQWYQLKFHESIEWLVPVYKKIFEFVLVSDSAKNLGKLPIITEKSILYKRAVEWVADNQILWKK